MAVASNAGYFFKHEDDTSAGILLPVDAYPTSVTPSDNIVSRSWNDMNGQFHDKIINLKLKVNWVFDYISESNMAIIYNYIYNSIMTYKTRFFEVNTYYPGRGFIRGKFYLGTPLNFESRAANSRLGEVTLWKFELHWIEKDGYVLNAQSGTEQ